jgi:hypothetical protein
MTKPQDNRADPGSIDKGSCIEPKDFGGIYAGASTTALIRQPEGNDDD